MKLTGYHDRGKFNFPPKIKTNIENFSETEKKEVKDFLIGKKNVCIKSQMTVDELDFIKNNISKKEFKAAKKFNWQGLFVWLSMPVIAFAIVGIMQLIKSDSPSGNKQNGMSEGEIEEFNKGVSNEKEKDNSFNTCKGCGKIYEHNGYYGGPGKGNPYGPLSHQYRADEYKNYSGGYCSQSCSMKYSD